MSHTVMVTGADGFIGSHLTEELVKAGEKVKAFCLYNSFGSCGWIDTLPPEIKSEIEIFMGEVRDPNGVRTAMRGQERVYSARDKVSLKLILRGKRIGFSLAECRELIELYDPSSGNQKQLNSMLGKIAERRQQLEQQLLDIQQMQLELDTAEERCTQALEQTFKSQTSRTSTVI